MPDKIQIVDLFSFRGSFGGITTYYFKLNSKDYAIINKPKGKHLIFIIYNHLEFKI